MAIVPYKYSSDSSFKPKSSKSNNKKVNKMACGGEKKSTKKCSSGKKGGK